MGIQGSIVSFVILAQHFSGTKNKYKNIVIRNLNLELKNIQQTLGEKECIILYLLITIIHFARDIFHF
jgi:hypothetical protein